MAPPKKTKVSVVVPTYNEGENLRPLTERLFAAMTDYDVELLFAEDESKGTEASEAIVKELQRKYNVGMHVRKRGEGRGLSSAVVLGFTLAKHDLLVCMDADLQHEPEAVPSVIAPVIQGAPFAIGSRNVQDGGLGFEWSLARRIISKGATLLAWPLTASTDPMSGFFALTRATFDNAQANGLNPRGFKIALEILVRSRSTVTDVPITFQDRHAGESKLSAKQNIDYILQLLALYLFLYTRTFVLSFVSAHLSSAAYIVAALVAAVAILIYLVYFLLQ